MLPTAANETNAVVIFGLGQAARRVEWGPTITTFLCLLLLIVIELLTYAA